jgi:drug/metabolite transporter (DMT)-like permease
VTEPVGPHSSLGTRVHRSMPWPASFLLLGAIWGCSFWWIKLGLRAVSPVDVAFLRLFAGASALLIIAVVTGTKLPHRIATWRHLFVFSFLINSAPFTLFAYGETHISAVLAGLINSLTPLATLGAVLLLFRQQRASRNIFIGLIIGFVGVLVVIGVWRGFGHGQLLGIGACVAAVLCYGVGLFGHVHQHPRASSIFGLLALGVLGTGIAYILNFHVVNNAPATVASSVTFLTPLFAVIVGVAFLHEALSWNEPVGAVLILAGAAIAQNRFRGRRSV